MRALLAAIAALGALLRLYGLNRESLWNDELSTVTRLSPGPLSDLFWARIAEDVHPPGYLLFLSAWTSLFGTSELALRLPSVFAGVGLIAFAYAFAARTFGRTTGLLAALFCAVSPLHIRYSQEARSFALVACTSLIAAWALVELERPAATDGTTRADVKRNWRWLAAFVASATVSAYLSYVGFLAMVALVAFAWGTIIMVGRDRAPRLAVATFLLVVSYLPWTYGLTQHLKQGGLAWLEPPKLEDLYRVFSLALPLHGWALVCCSIALGSIRQGASTASDSAVEVRPSSSMALWLLAWMAFILPVSFYLKSIWSTPIYNDRNLLVVVPFFAMLAAIGLASTVPKRTALLAGTLVTAATLGHFVSVDRFYSTPIKQDFRGAAALASSWIEQGTADEIACLSWNKEYFAYYLRRHGISKSPTCDPRGDRLASKLHKLARHGKPIAFVYGHIVPSDAFWRQVRKDFSISETHPLHKAGAALLQPK